MFLGTIEPVVRNFLAAHGDVFKGQIVAVGCSGNFTSERVLWEATGQDVKLYSNDVSLYSSMIGGHLAGKPLEVEVKEEQYAWLTPLLAEGGWKRIATLLVFYRALTYERQQNTHAKRMWHQYLLEFKTLVNDTAERLEKLSLRIAGYHAGDIFEHFKALDTEFGDRVIYTSYMPFFRGGYERLYRRMEQIFEWEKPTYPILDDERRIEIAQWCAERRHVTLLNFPLPDQEPVMIGHTKRNVHVYMYSNILEKTALYRRLHPDQGVRFRLWGEKDVIRSDSQIKITPISTFLIQPYKSLYLARTIDFSTGMFGFAISLDGKVIGFIELKYGIGEEAYLFSDFPVGWRFHKRQSKLIAMLALCEEVRRSLELTILRRHTCVITTAWTDKPVSMKYRGVFKLVNRNKAKGLLNYQADWSGLTAQETFELWMQKHAKELTTSTSS